MQTNLVSIIIPTYNRADLLQEALYSVFNQSYRPLECIIVDDGSVDKTAIVVDKFVKTYQSSDLTFKYYYQTQSGAPTARNLGTINATGDFIQYLDSDDLLYPEKLSEQVNFLRNNETYEAVFGDWDSGLPGAFVNIKAYASKDLVAQLLTLERSIANFSILMRRSLVLRIGLWDTQLRRCQEIDFHLRGLMTGAQYHYQEIVTGLWRHHADTRIHNTTNPADFIPFFKKWQIILSEKKLFTLQLAKKIAVFYMWIISQNKILPNKKLIQVISETVRLDPQIAFFNTKSMLLLRKFVGEKAALNVWIIRKRITGRKQLNSQRNR
jgi:glycosyltransferase involved in cell wall biosynthesis